MAILELLPAAAGAGIVAADPLILVADRLGLAVGLLDDLRISHGISPCFLLLI